MKPLRKYLKLIAVFLAVTFLMQSWNVYTYKATTVDEAVNSNYKQVKVKSYTDQTYRFEELEKVNEGYYRSTYKDSKTAKKLTDQITYEDGFEYVKILLREEQLYKVYVKEYNNTMSTVLTYVALLPILASTWFGIATYWGY